MTRDIEQFIQPGSSLVLTHGRYPHTPPRCERAVTLMGNVAGFRSLADILCRYRNYLESMLYVSDLPFVESKMACPFVIDLDSHGQYSRALSGVVAETEAAVLWRLSDWEAGLVTMALHGLGYAWNHLHFDPPSPEVPCGVYCGLEK